LAMWESLRGSPNTQGAYGRKGPKVQEISSNVYIDERIRKSGREVRTKTKRGTKENRKKVTSMKKQ